MYSERPGTLAAKKYKDDVPEAVKKKRLQEIIELQMKHSYENNLKDLNKVHKVLIEGYSKKSDKNMKGRNDANKMIIFPDNGYKIGDYVMVKVSKCTSATLIGEVVELVETIDQ